jgi:uncharacterized protein YqjF (DUF2071 family)
MLDFLKDHPFAVESFFDTSLVLTYGVRKQELLHLIPSCLTLDTFEDEWAFIAVAMVQTRHLRPKGFPKFIGNDFVLTGYRIFVRYNTSQGKRLRGLYIIGSETNRKKMEVVGNIFTHYNYKTTDINFSKNGDIIEVRSIKSGLDVRVRAGNDENIPLPTSSPFKNWKEARRYAGPLPFTFTYNERTNEVLIIEGVREDWTPKPVQVVNSEVGFLNSLNLKTASLANAFVINNIPYYWKKGKKDLWKQS